jgi:hypothetical protein
MRNAYKILVGKFEGIHLDDLGVDSKGNRVGRCELQASGSKEGPKGEFLD